MSQQITTTTQPQHSVTLKPSALTAMATRFNVEPSKLLDTLKQTAFKNATDAQMMSLCIVANEFGLNPFLKQIYAFPDKGGGIVPVVGVDGWVKIMNDHPQFDGIEFEEHEENGKPVSCTAIIYRKDRTRPIRVTEHVSECSRNTDPWRTSPRRMIRHKSMIQGARLAFGFSGIHDEDEAEFVAARPVGGVVVGIEKADLPQRPALPSSSPTKVVSEEETTPVQVETPAKASRIATRPKKEEPAKPAPAPEPEPEPTPEPEATPEPEVEAVVIDSTEVAQEPITLAESVLARAISHGFTEEHLVKMAIRANFVNTTATKASDIGDEQLDLIAADWEDAVSMMTAIKAKGAK